MHRNTNPKKPMRLNRRKVGERVFLCVMLAYPVLQFLIFYVGVNINSVLLAFKSFSSETGGYYFNGLVNFENVIYTLSHDTAIAGSFGRGMIMYACGVIIGIPLHFSVAYLLYKKIPLAGFFRVVLFIPSLVPGIAIAIMFKYFVEYGVSEIYKIFGAETIPNFFMDPDVAFPLVIFYGIWTGVASGMVIYMSAMSRIPQSVIDHSNGTFTQTPGY